MAQKVKRIYSNLSEVNSNNLRLIEKEKQTDKWMLIELNVGQKSNI